jgi:SAM-dependent methyltransferase
MRAHSRGSKRQDWSRRVLGTELLECAESAPADRNLRDIARINRWFGGHHALLRMMRDLATSDERFSVLDVGAGSGDMGRCLTGYFPNAKVISLDHRRSHLRNAPSPRVVADALELPFPTGSFDFVLCSSVLHHFPDDGVIDMIASLRLFARRALLLLDLERHPLAYHFLPMTKRVFGWCPLTVHDGPISVAAAFRVEELASLANAAGASVLTARRHWPWFRMSVVVPSRAPQIARISGASQPQAFSSAAD